MNLTKGGEYKSAQVVCIPNDPRVLKYTLNAKNVKILKCLMQLEQEHIRRCGKNPFEEFHNPGPYLSLIHERCKMNKRTTMVRLNDMERGKLVDSILLQHEIGGRQQLIRVFRLNPALDFGWLKEINI